MLIVAMLLAMGPYVRIDGQVLLWERCQFIYLHKPLTLFSRSSQSQLSMPIDTVL